MPPISGSTSICALGSIRFWRTSPPADHFDGQVDNQAPPSNTPPTDQALRRRVTMGRRLLHRGFLKQGLAFGLLATIVLSACSSAAPSAGASGAPAAGGALAR